MIISKTPLRISFLGGGTDYPEYYRKYGGAVLGTAIDKFAYVSVSKFFSGLFDYSIRISYRKVECVRQIDEIEHAPFREALRYTGLDRDIEVNYSAELPALTGLGGSSTFVVGLLNALFAFQGKATLGLDLAKQAIYLERDVLGEAVGCQDQVFAAVGGLNVIEFGDEIHAHQVPLHDERRRELEDHLLLVYTGIQRRATDMAARQIARIDSNRGVLAEMSRLVDAGYAQLVNHGSLEDFGHTIDQSWRLKTQLDDGVASAELFATYERGLTAGAFGGKLLGAGGGGFFLYVAPPERHAHIVAELGGMQRVPIAIDAPGSAIIHSDAAARTAVVATGYA